MFVEIKKSSIQAPVYLGVTKTYPGTFPEICFVIQSRNLTIFRKNRMGKPICTSKLNLHFSYLSEPAKKNGGKGCSQLPWLSGASLCMSYLSNAHWGVVWNLGRKSPWVWPLISGIALAFVNVEMGWNKQRNKWGKVIMCNSFSRQKKPELILTNFCLDCGVYSCHTLNFFIVPLIKRNLPASLGHIPEERLV